MGPSPHHAICVAAFMERMHGIIRQNDADTMVCCPFPPCILTANSLLQTLFAPAEINNRLMRHVGYKAGFLPGEPMAFHTYCLTGTDGPGSHASLPC
jgi:hypothetical protein